MISRNTRRVMLGTAALTVFFPSVASAGVAEKYGVTTADSAAKKSNVTASATEAADESGNEIIVTAQRREQTLQDVPLSVTAISGDSIEKAKISSITDLQTSTPGLNATTSNRPATSSSFSIRGVGTSGNDPGLEGAVGFSVDEVYRARSGSSLGDFVDIDRIEVLRGPQGTLFGKNTTAGVIQVTTRKPNLAKAEGFLEGTVGNYNLKRLQGAVNTPIIADRLAVRIVGGYNFRDGFLRDSVTGNTYSDRNRFNLAAKVLFEVSPDVSAYLVVDYAESHESCCVTVRFTNAQSAGANAPYIAFLATRAALNGTTYPVVPTPTLRNVALNMDPVNRNQDRGVMFKLSAKLGAADLTSITSYRSFHDFEDNDIDFTGADIASQKIDFRLRVLSQEVRLQGSGLDGHLDWLVGGFYANEKIKYQERASIGSDAGPYFTLLSPALANVGYVRAPDSFGGDSRQTNNTFAVFTHNIFTITDGLHFTAGLRYTSEDKAAVSNPIGFATTPVAGALAPIGQLNNPYNLGLKEHAFSGTAVLDYHWSPDVMTYASYSRGYKSGGFGLGNASAGPVYSRLLACTASGNVAASGTVVGTIYRCDPRDPRFKAETVNSYEIGMRTQFFDHRGTFNLTFFRGEYKNLQLNIFNGFRFELANAGSAVSQGVEGEAGFKLATGLRLSANLSYLDAKFGSSVPSVASGEPALGGTRLNNSPRWSGAFSASLDRPISNSVSIFARPEVYFRTSTLSSTRVTTAGGKAIMPGITLFNMTGGLRFNDWLEVSAYCRNCTNVTYPVVYSSSVAQPGSKDYFLGSPAEYGASLRFKF